MFHLSETERPAPAASVLEFAKVAARRATLRGMRGVDEVQNGHGRKFLREWIARAYEGNNKEAAKALGVSGSLVSEVLSGKRGFGMKMLRALSQNAGATIESILGNGGTVDDDDMSHEERARRQFLGLFVGTEKLEAERYVAEKLDEAARLPSDWSVYEFGRYWVTGFDTWRAVRKGKAVSVVVSVDDMDEDEATPAFAKKTRSK